MTRLSEAVMDIVQANIDRFKLLLKTENDPVKRSMQARLLAEEEAKLAARSGDKKGKSDAGGA